MTGPSQTAPGYFAQLGRILWHAVTQVLRPPAHSRRAEAARHWAKRSLAFGALTAVVIIALMYLLDVYEIGLMPPRGTASLWPLRIVTDFGKSEYVLWVLFALLIFIMLVAPRLRGVSRAIWLSVGTRVQYIFLTVGVAVILGELLKGTIGRGRPFVGGAANAFHYSHFSWSEIYASFPSGHATTSFALAFAVGALWPRLRMLMIAYAVIICCSRLVLLAHHPSDVVAGGLLGWIVAMAMRYWFAARHLAFTIRPGGETVPLPGPSWGHVKRVAREAIAP
ncbi:phosphatase PAP2 family protein [Tardiphaga alba]|uniref:Phosphatase PAP2 family protein n=1 Tax=Tardiphaga alba TaxID=340268 RepID=A0ABX8ADP1_9BRAD|nr:phosphatase PAP2 family protein [Tardiphaga alba]QUS39935.1 phosphatase PAP2 family protein [Tardiphaga alba]